MLYVALNIQIATSEHSGKPFSYLRLLVSVHERKRYHIALVTAYAQL
jgi:hypothetical protein